MKQSPIFENVYEIERFSSQFSAMAVNVYESSTNETGQRYGWPRRLDFVGEIGRRARSKPLYRINIKQKG